MVRSNYFDVRLSSRHTHTHAHTHTHTHTLVSFPPHTADDDPRSHKQLEPYTRPPQLGMPMPPAKGKVKGKGHHK